MNRVRTLQHPPTDNDDVESPSENREEPISIVVAEQASDAPSVLNAKDVLTAVRSFFEEWCPFLVYSSSHTLGVLLILCVTVIWVASSNWIQYIFGNLNYSKPYFLTYFNTTGFSLWNLGYYCVPGWTRIPWDDRQRPQPILVEDQSIALDEPHATYHQQRSRSRIHDRGDSGSVGGGGDETVTLAGSLWRRRGNPYSGDTRGEPNYETDIRVWAVNNGYDPSLFSSEPSSFSSVSMEEIIDVGDVPDLAPSQRPASAPFLMLEARGGERGGGGGGGNMGFLPQPRPQPRRQLARVERVRPYARRKLWFWAAVFCPFWFFANYFFNASLAITSVASNTVLSATSSVWTLLLSYLLLNESVGPLKWIGIAFCVTGSILVGVSDNGSGSGSGKGGGGGGDGGGKNTVFGNVIALLSAFFYAVYTSILRYGLPDDERYAMGMVFGAVGVINFICLWPGLVLVDLLNWEKFEWPSIGQFWPLLLNALIGTNLSDVLWARSVVLTSPVVATLGLSLTTPLAMIVDAAFKGAHFSTAYVIGASFVMCGFVMANLPILEHWPRWARLSW